MIIPITRAGAILIAVFSISAVSSPAQTLPYKLVHPIKGVLGTDYFIVNHVDHDHQEGAIRDHACGTQTYDGHQGTDFVLKSFRQMDSGVTVVAAAKGRVTAVVDSFPDRNKVSVKDRGFGNYVALVHDGGVVTYYAHNRRGSAIVNVGDTVEAGQALALVGSSGNSEDPHVHFEVWQLVDPFDGACETGTVEWRSPNSYQTTLRVIDADLTTWYPTLDTLRERPPSATVVGPLDSVVAQWALLQAVRPTDQFRIQWITPESAVWFTYEANAGITSNYFYWWSWIDRPDINGVWTCILYVNDAEVSRHTFTVTGVVSAPEPDIHSTVTVRRYDDVVRISNAAGCEVAVFDLQGRLLLTHRLVDAEHALIVPRLPMLILQITDRNSAKTRTLVTQ